MAQYPIKVSARLLSWPHQCCCCGEFPDTELSVTATRAKGVRVIRTTSHTWRVPYCSSCLGHIRRYRRARLLTVLGILVALFSGFVEAMSVPTVGIAMVAIIISATVFIRLLIRQAAENLTKASCACQFEAVEYLGWHYTIHQFAFVSWAYAKAFATLNSKKIVS